MVTRREQGMTERYEEVLRGADALEERVMRLVRLRAAEGYMAESFRRDDGTYVIIENHCPICAAAAACKGFCRSELALFTRLLAPAQVERSEHLLAGSRRCSYLVAPASAVRQSTGWKSQM
jgi:predicted ArsR family transcriptional regulator